MAATPSTMVALGTPAPLFELPATDGRSVSLDGLRGANALVIIFMCNHCPFVKLIAPALALFSREYQQKGVAVIGISSNNAETHPDDSFEKMQAEAKSQGYTFPYLYDETQEIAKAYGAACTPDFFVYDKDFHLVYRGQFDDARPGNGKPVTGADLRTALDAVLAAKPVPQPQKPSLGCNIKWKPGNEPNYPAKESYHRVATRKMPHQ